MMRASRPSDDGFTLIEIMVVVIIIGLLAYGIDRLLFWFQRGLFPYRVVEE